jgi:ubiquinone/menaquinone biosynthesis C-methylase UbiE
MARASTDDVKSIVAQHWNRRAASFDEGASHGLLNAAQEQAWRAVLARLAGAAPLDVLDVGCGTGFLALLAAEAGHRATGIDMADAMLSHARAKAEVRRLAVAFQRADAEAPPFAAKSFDLIVERHVIWTLPDPTRALRNWQTLLRPGGRVALIEGDWDMAPKDEYASVHKRLPLFGGVPGEELAQLLRAWDFADVTVEPLMDAALWTEMPSHPRYVVVGRRPADGE